MNTTNIHPPLRKWQAEALPLALDCVLKQLAGESEPQVISACTGSGKSRLIAELVAARAALLLEEQVIVVTTPTRRLVRQLSATLAEHISQPIAQHYTSAKWRGKARIIVCCNASAPGLAKMLAAAGKTIALWIADEAHKTETPEITRFCEDAPALTCIGFTATPFRSSNKETLQRFDAELYRYTPTMALADGCLVPWRAVTWTLPGTELDESCITMIQSHYTRGPGVVNARSIDDAESFAVKLSKKGIKSSAIRSKLTTAEQDALLERLREADAGFSINVVAVVFSATDCCCAEQQAQSCSHGFLPLDSLEGHSIRRISYFLQTLCVGLTGACYGRARRRRCGSGSLCLFWWLVAVRRTQMIWGPIKWFLVMTLDNRVVATLVHRPVDPSR